MIKAFLIAGTRTFEDYCLLRSEMDRIIKDENPDSDEVLIISGGCRGADSLAKKYAAERGFSYREFKAEWERYGKTAGPIRNANMHMFLASYECRNCILFWDGESRGTRGNIRLCERYGTPVRIIRYQPKP